MNIAVFVSGSGTNLQAIIDRIENDFLRGVSISLVLSSREDVYALERARINQIPSLVIRKKDYKSQKTYDQAMIDALEGKDIDLIVLAGFLSKLGPDFISKYRWKIINIHPSLIPAFSGEGMYGLKPHEAALARGVKLTGATVHFVDEVYDNGPIILQKSVEINDDDSPQSLQKRVMAEAEQLLLPLAIKMIRDGDIPLK